MCPVYLQNNGGNCFIKRNKRSKINGTKKRYPFQEWVKRTTKTLKEEEIVTKYMLDANEKIKQYYRLNMTEDQIESIEVDDWIALFRKE